MFELFCLRLQGEYGACPTGREAMTELVLQPDCGRGARAVEGDEVLNVKLTQGLYGFSQSSLVGANQVHPPDNRMYGALGDKRPDVVQRIDDARVCAPHDYNRAAIRLDVGGLVIDQIVRFLAGFIFEEGPASVLEIGVPRYGACNKQLPGNGDGACGGSEYSLVDQRRPGFRGHSNRAARAILVARVLVRQGCGVGKYGYRTGAVENTD